jgi:hypothetical protein
VKQNVLFIIRGKWNASNIPNANGCGLRTKSKAVSKVEKEKINT